MTIATDYESFSWKVDKNNGITEITPKGSRIEDIINEMAESALRLHVETGKVPHDVLLENLKCDGNVNTNLKDGNSVIEILGANYCPVMLFVTYQKGKLQLANRQYDFNHEISHEIFLQHVARNLITKKEIKACNPLDDEGLADLFGSEIREKK